jgi:site-specific recombinase XerD
MNLKFILHSKKNTQGEHPIYLRITANSKKTHVKTKLKIVEKYWNKEKGKAKATNAFPDAQSINNQLSYIERKVVDCQSKYWAEHYENPELKELKTRAEFELFGGTNPENKLDLLSYYNDYIIGLPNKLNDKGRPFSQGYINSHKQTLLKVATLCKEKKLSVEFDNIDIQFNDAFIKYLNTFQYTTNYIGKQIKNIKTVLNHATLRGYNTSLKFKQFKELTEDTVKVVLSEKELDELYQLDLSNKPKLDVVRDIFLVGCWTGLRYSDLSSFSKKAKINGNVISIKAQKTQEYVSVPLHQVTKSILEKHSYSLPKLSEPKFNLRIKKLGALIPSLTEGIEFEITKGGKLINISKPRYEMMQSHSARRSFATNMFLRKVPTETIMAITGHKKASTFYKYIQLPPNHHAEYVANIFNSTDLT